MLVCQLPAAFRRLPRPSSPVIAKASTTCTLSLDPITVSPLQVAPHQHSQLQSHALRLLAPNTLLCVSGTCRYNHTNPVDLPPPKPSREAHTFPHAKPRTASDRFTSSSLLKNSRTTGIRYQLSGISNRARRCRPSIPLITCLLIPDPWCMVELIGIEPTTPCLQSRCSPS